jgi:hypothetical protein
MPSRPPPEARMAPTPEGWRCTCMVYVVPGEEHRCFYRDILAVLDRIAVQLEKRPVPVPEFNLTAAGEIIRKGGL